MRQVVCATHQQGWGVGASGVVVWCGGGGVVWWYGVVVVVLESFTLSFAFPLFHPLTQIAELSLHVGSKCLHTELSEGWNKYLLSAAKLR